MKIWALVKNVFETKWQNSIQTGFSKRKNVWAHVIQKFREWESLGMILSKDWTMSSGFGLLP